MSATTAEPTSISPLCLPEWPHAISTENILLTTRVDADRGLSSAEAHHRLQRFGRNCLAEAPPVPLWQRLASQFKDLVIWILIIAALISGAMGEWVDTMAILAIVLLNGAIGFFQEERAERSLTALRQLSAPTA